MWRKLEQTSDELVYREVDSQVAQALTNGQPHAGNMFAQGWPELKLGWTMKASDDLGDVK